MVPRGKGTLPAERRRGKAGQGAETRFFCVCLAWTQVAKKRNEGRGCLSAVSQLFL